MTAKNLPFIFAGILIVVAGIIMAVFKVYPVASVDGSLITDRSFEKQYAAAYQYYQKFVLSQSSSSPDTEEFHKNLRLVTLDGMIESIITEHALSVIFGQDVAESLMAKKFADAKSDAQLESAVRDLYGLSLGDFKEMILVPAAREEILAEKLFLDKKKPEDFIKEQRLKAKVFIFLPGFVWKEGMVVAAGQSVR